MEMLRWKIALCKGKKRFDKRAAIKKKQTDREMERFFKRRR